MRRHPVWSLDQWDRFGARCQLARRRLRILAETFPPTHGLNRTHFRALADAEIAVGFAMISAERLLRRQHRSFIARLGAFERIHGRGPHGALSLPPAFASKGSDPLPVEQWERIADELRAAAEEVRTLTVDITGASGVRAEELRTFTNAQRLIDVARERLDTLAFGLHPGWAGRRAAFFGADAIGPPGTAHAVRQKKAREQGASL